MCTSPVVQAAWARGQPLSVHGVVYALEDGLLKVRSGGMGSGWEGARERSQSEGWRFSVPVSCAGVPADAQHACNMTVRGSIGGVGWGGVVLK